MSEHEFQPIGDPLFDAQGEASEIAANASITHAAFSAIESLTTALHNEQQEGRFGYISERRKLANMLRRLALWIDRNPPPPPKQESDDD